MSHTQYLTVATIIPVVQIDHHVMNDEMVQSEIACAPFPLSSCPFPNNGKR